MKLSVVTISILIVAVGITLTARPSVPEWHDCVLNWTDKDHSEVPTFQGAIVVCREGGVHLHFRILNGERK